MEVSGQLDTPVTLPPPVTTGQEAGWAADPVWTRWWREELRDHAGIRIPVAQPVSVVTILTELYWFVKTEGKKSKWNFCR